MNKVKITSCYLFNNLNDNELKSAISFFDCKEETYKKGELIASPDKLPKKFGLVLSGCVQIYTLDIDGYQMIMATVLPGETFGESLSYLKKEAPIFIHALSDTVVMWMSTEKLREQKIVTECDKKLSYRFTSLLANRALSMNDRIQILSKLTIREKLIAFFTEAVRKYNAYSFTLPFDRSDMATYLGCDRSSLSRELSKMQKEGLITFTKNSFTVHKKADILMNFQ
ncbi:MAG: Crp/Fnr family transcriptional regulator [Clostridia bacterium]|nr:Crp/Fnr family transcriptional regulator [Clostridia bacterium]